MRHVEGRPTIRQLKRWCENEDLITFTDDDDRTVKEAIIEKVIPLGYSCEDYNVNIKVRKLGEENNSYSCEHSIEYNLKHISSYFVPDKTDSILLSPTNFSKKDVLLQFGNSSKYLNKKLLSARSKFFRKLIKKKEKELSSWKFFTCIPKSKKPTSIRLDNLFVNEQELNLLLFLLDKEQIDDFIHTPQDALALFEIINKYPLRKSRTGIRKIENQIKNKFFELIGYGVPFVKPDQSGIKTQFFLDNLKQELFAYCKRDKTKPCLALLNYYSQIKKTNNLTLDASTNAAYTEALRLLIFCNFKIVTLITIAITPKLFRDVDLSSLPLHTLKMHPSPHWSPGDYFYHDCMTPLFNMIKNSKSLTTVQIGNPNPHNSSIISYLLGPCNSYGENSSGWIFCFPKEIVRDFNSLKRILDARVKFIYETAVVNRFFKQYLPKQQSRLIVEFLTLDDLDCLRKASRDVDAEIHNLRSLPKNSEMF